MRKKVFYLRDLDNAGKQVFADNGWDIFISKGRDHATWQKEILREQPHALMVLADRVDSELIDASKNLRAIGKQGIGLDNIDVDYAKSKGIEVFGAPNGNADSVAEHTLLLMLDCAKRFTFVDRQFRGGNFNIRLSLTGTTELKDMTLGLIGCGRIGQALATKASDGFSMKVVGFDPYVTQEQLHAPITLVENKADLLAQSDFVSLHLPSLPSTRGSIGSDDFHTMKNTAFFINCARGDVVNEDALIEALRSGEIAGAGLDVFADEPFRYDTPLLSMDNVVLTPHMAGSTWQAKARCAKMSAESIIHLFAEE